MRKTTILVFGGVLAAGYLMAGPPGAHSAPQNADFTVVVDGKDITAGIVQFRQDHATASTPDHAATCANLAQGTGLVMADANNHVVLNHGVVKNVYLVDEIPGLRRWAYDPDSPWPKKPGGDAQVTKTGNGYKITGHVSTIEATSTQPGPLVPFEFDVTCA